ncbi:hypothetical protein CROQUDRAFT_18355, partial [Cronartium quercuum f. sp. fusiforme G11]
EIAQLQAEAYIPQISKKDNMSKHTTDARHIMTKPRTGRAHTKISPCTNMTFSGCGSQLFPLGIIEIPIIFPHPAGNIKILAEFVVMEN